MVIGKCLGIRHSIFQNWKERLQFGLCMVIVCYNDRNVIFLGRLPTPNADCHYRGYRALGGSLLENYLLCVSGLEFAHKKWHLHFRLHRTCVKHAERVDPHGHLHFTPQLTSLAPSSRLPATLMNACRVQKHQWNRAFPAASAACPGDCNKPPV